MRKYLVLLMCLVITACSGSGACYLADDFGDGLSLYIDSDPINAQPSMMINPLPPTNQSVAWYETSAYTTGVPSSINGQANWRGIFKVYISGSWSPWGGNLSTLPSCSLGNCAAVTRALTCDYITINSFYGGYPCKLSGGKGLYGLISIQQSDGSYPDPANFLQTNFYPANLFRTFYMQVTGSDADGSYFQMGNTTNCDPANPSTCTPDADSQGNPVLVKGKLYLRILDGYYADNAGGYNIQVVSGIYQKSVFIQTATNSLLNAAAAIGAKFNNSIGSNSSFLGYVKAFLTTFIAFQSLLFLMGMVQISHKELLIRLFKVAIIMMLISDPSAKFFSGFVLSLAFMGALDIAGIISQNVMLYNHDANSPVIFLAAGSTITIPFSGATIANPLAAFEPVFKIFIAPQVHYKIWSLLFWFSNGYFLLIIPIYIVMFLIIASVIECMVILLMSFVFITIALMLAPLFLTFILFQTLKSLFDEWLNLVISSSITIVVVMVVIVLMLSLVMGKFENLLRFKICWEAFYNFPLINVSMNWWVPQHASEVNTALSATNLVSILIIASLFKAVVQMIPMLTDALAQSNLGVAKGGFSSVMEGLNEMGAQLRSVASPAGLIDLAMAAKNRMSKDEKDEKGQVRAKTTLDDSSFMKKLNQASDIVSALDKKILGGAVENKTGIMDGIFDDSKEDKKDEKKKKDENEKEADNKDGGGGTGGGAN